MIIFELELMAKKDVMNHDILRPYCKLNNFVNLVENKRCSISGGLLDIEKFNFILEKFKDFYHLDEILVFSSIDENVVQFLGAKILTHLSKSKFQWMPITYGMKKVPAKIDYLSFQSELIDMGLDKMANFDPTYAEGFRKLHSFWNDGKI